MSEWKVSEMDGKSNQLLSKVKPITAGSKAAFELRRLGMTDAGIRQLSSGQPISNRKDQAIISRIVAAALG